MTTINQKLGLKPRTRKRTATHGTALASSVSCPSCGGAHVIRTQSRNGRLAGDFMCGSCGEFFNEEEATMADTDQNDDPKDPPAPSNQGDGASTEPDAGGESEPAPASEVATAPKGAKAGLTGA